MKKLVLMIMSILLLCSCSVTEEQFDEIAKDYLTLAYRTGNENMLFIKHAMSDWESYANANESLMFVNKLNEVVPGRADDLQNLIASNAKKREELDRLKKKLKNYPKSRLELNATLSLIDASLMCFMNACEKNEGTLVGYLSDCKQRVTELGNYTRALRRDYPELMEQIPASNQW